MSLKSALLPIPKDSSQCQSLIDLLCQSLKHFHCLSRKVLAYSIITAPMPKRLAYTRKTAPEFERLLCKPRIVRLQRPLASNKETPPQLLP